MKRAFPLVILIFVAIGAGAGGFFGRLPKTNAEPADGIVSHYQEAVAVVDANYVSPIKYEALTESSIQSMLWTLDPHSSFFSREEFQKLNEEQRSQFYGIGVNILQHHDGVYIESVIKGTPAEKAGLRYGDRFLEIEGKDATKWTSSEVSKNVRGERGSPVHVKIDRAGESQPVEYDIVRGGVPLPSIRNYFMLPNGVGYVGLSGGFQDTTADELDAAAEDLKKQGMKSLILDLRGNPGGLLPQAIEIVSRFVPAGKTVVSVKGRSKYARTEELKTSGGATLDLPLVVLINNSSASASEIVAGAVQDYDRGVVVGTNSFGKGLVQREFLLPYGTGMTLTMARYYTPFGRSLQRDYSNGSIYDYYTHQRGDDDSEDSEKKTMTEPPGVPIQTANGRTLYGGRGIEPDIKAEPTKFNQLRARISEAAFFFARQLAAGKVVGFENLKAEKQSYQMTVEPDDLVVSEKLFAAFQAFVAADAELGLTAGNLASDALYARNRLRSEIATAKYSNEAGNQVLLENDAQILKALEQVTESKKVFERWTASRG